MLPYLERLTQHAVFSALSQVRSESVIEAYLTASIISQTGIHQPDPYLNHVRNFDVSNPPDHLRLRIACRHSVILRHSGDYSNSEAEISRALASAGPFQDPITVGWYWRLLLSRAENAILHHQLDKVTDILISIKVRETPSIFECDVLWMKNIVHARAFRYDGRFEVAADILKDSLVVCKHSSQSSFQILHHLADVYCELGQVAAVRGLLEMPIQSVKARKAFRSIEYRRLLLSWAEMCFIDNKLTEATAALKELACVFNTVTAPGVSEQLDHVRWTVGLARAAFSNSEWIIASGHLDDASYLIWKYETFEDKSFYAGLVWRFRAIVYYKLGMGVDCEQAHYKAGLFKSSRRHFIAGFGTYLLDQLLGVASSQS